MHWIEYAVCTWIWRKRINRRLSCPIFSLHFLSKWLAKLLIVKGNVQWSVQIGMEEKKLHSQAMVGWCRSSELHFVSNYWIFYFEKAICPRERISNMRALSEFPFSPDQFKGNKNTHTRHRSTSDRIAKKNKTKASPNSYLPCYSLNNTSYAFIVGRALFVCTLFFCNLLRQQLFRTFIRCSSFFAFAISSSRSVALSLSLSVRFCHFFWLQWMDISYTFLWQKKSAKLLV